MEERLQYLNTFVSETTTAVQQIKQEVFNHQEIAQNLVEQTQNFNRVVQVLQLEFGESKEENSQNFSKANEIFSQIHQKLESLSSQLEILRLGQQEGKEIAGKMGEQQLGRILQKIAENENSVQSLHREMITFVEETENSRELGQNSTQIWKQIEERFKVSESTFRNVIKSEKIFKKAKKQTGKILQTSQTSKAQTKLF